MAILYLLLGSNLGNKIENLDSAEKDISHRIGNLSAKSSIYRSPPWGFEYEEDFLNQALQIETHQLPGELLNTILSIEKKFGRKRSCKSKIYLPRTIDIDILLYGNTIINTEELTIPHPRLHLRRFALVPLNEIAPALIHPVFKISISELLVLCEDKSKITRLA